MWPAPEWIGFAFLGLALVRLPAEKALENTNRRRLYSFIKQDPGATFREVLRQTRLPAGTARHHLNVLARSDMIVERRHRCTLRYFENHGRHADWRSVVLLREPALACIHAWLCQNPGAVQKDLLEHAATNWHWNRSSTQHRLHRLVSEGLVEFHQTGRYKHYRTVQKGAPRGPPEKNP